MSIHADVAASVGATVLVQRPLPWPKSSKSTTNCASSPMRAALAQLVTACECDRAAMECPIIEALEHAS